jgi:hypothetical protein
MRDAGGTPNRELGHRIDDVMVMAVDVRMSAAADRLTNQERAARRRAFFEEALFRAQSVAGVKAALATSLPIHAHHGRTRTFVARGGRSESSAVGAHRGCHAGPAGSGQGVD